MHFWLWSPIGALFCTAVGLAESGIVANLYRLVGKSGRTTAREKLVYRIMMIAGGPSVLIQNATTAILAKQTSGLAYALALALALYWSLILGYGSMTALLFMFPQQG